MSSELYIDGVEFVTASDAAESTGLTRDYIGRLCREGRLSGKRIGKQWYVSRPSLNLFYIEQEHAKALRREELSEQRSAEYQASSLREGVVQEPAADPMTVRLAQALGAQSIAKLPALASPGSAHAAAWGGAHLTPHALGVATDIAHKVVALTLALLLTFGSYALVDPATARAALGSLRDTVRSVPIAATVAVDAFGDLSQGDRPQAATAGALLDGLASSAKRFSARVDSFFFEAAFPFGRTASGAHAGDRQDGTVVVRVLPMPVATKQQEQVSSSAPQQISAIRSAVPRQVIERVVETQRILSSGGITEAQLTERLQELDNKLSSRMYSLASANTTSYLPSPVAIAQMNAIDQLYGTAIHGATITDSSFSGGSIDAARLSTGDLLAGNATTTNLVVTGSLTVPSLSFSGLVLVDSTTTNATTTNLFADSFVASAATTSVFYSDSITLGAPLPISSGGTGTSSIPSYGQLLIGDGTGGYALVATSSLGIVGGGGPGTPGGSARQLQFNDYGTFAGSADFTISTSTGEMSVTGGIFSRATVTAATSSSIFSTLARFTDAVTDTFSSSLATLTGAVITNSTTTNATTTNLYASSFVAGGATTTSLRSSTLSLGSLTGPLQAQDGIVSASSTLSIAYGGTGTSTAPAYGQLLIGNALGGFDYVATSSLGINSGVWGSITGSIAAQTDLQNALAAKLNLSDWYSTTTSDIEEGSNLYFTTARATTSFVGNLAATTSVASITTLPNLSLPYSQLTGAPTSLASSTLLSDANTFTGTNTFASTIQGSVSGNAGTVTNGVYTTTFNGLFDSRFVTDLAGTTSVSSITTLANLVLPATQLSGFGVPFFQYFSATTTDALAEGSVHKYYSSTLFAADLAATTSVNSIVTLNSLVLPASQVSGFSSAATSNFVSNLAATTSVASITTLPNLSITESQISDLAHYTSSDVNAFVAASTSIPKTYTSNTFSLLQTFQNATSTSFSSTYASSTALFAGFATTSALYISGTIAGAGLSACSGSADKLLWNATTRQFECGADAGAGGGITALKAQYSTAQTGSTQTFATSSDANIGLTITSSGDTHTFAPTWSGTLAVDRGGTGAASFSYGLILSPGGTGALASVATSSLGLLTTDVAEGSNLYYQDARVNAYLAASSTVPKTYANNTFSGTNTFTQTITGSVSGNAGTATALQNARAINGISFDGTADITIAAASSTLLADSSRFTGSNVFAGNTTLAGATSSSFAIANLADTLLYANGSGSIISVATSSLGLPTFADVTSSLSSYLSLSAWYATTTDQLAEGTNHLYFTTARATTSFVGNLAATTSVASITALPNLSLPYGQISGAPTSLASSTLLSDSNTFTGTNTFTSPISGSVTGNAGTVTNGVYTNTFNGLFDTRFVTDLAATTSISSITTLPNLSLPSAQVTGLFAYLFPGNATTTGLGIYASTTIGSGTATGGLTISGTATTTNLKVTSVTSALHLADGAGNVGAYSGTSCTNQFVRSLNGAGVATCASVNLASDVTGTLPVGSGGTGQSSFAQGWLHSDGTTLTSSTSPTVAYITATSTIASSTFPNLAVSGNLGLNMTTGSILFAGTGGLVQQNNGRLFFNTSQHRLGLSTTSPFALLSINPNADAQPSFVIGSSTAAHLIVDPTGRLGLGTTSPSAQFAMTGSAYIGGILTAGPIIATGTLSALGLTSYASSTIGSGTQAGGLTIVGGATTTGNAYIAGALSLGSALGPTSGGTGIGSYATGDLLYADASNHLAVLPIGGAGTVLKVAAGVPTWGTDLTTGGGGGAGAWSTTTDSLAIYPTNTSNVIIVGSNATVTASSIFEVTGKSYFSNSIGIATTSPGSLLSIGGVANFGLGGSTLYGPLTLGTLTATSSASFGAATTTSLAITGIASSLLKADANGSIIPALAGTDYLAPASLASYLALVDWYSTTTDQLAEGTNNLYFTTARATTSFVGNLAATTSVASITTLPNLSLPSSQVTGLFAYLFPGNATTTGLGIYASTTIGSGTATGGLTVSGTATTTNLINTSITSALGLYDANHKETAYAGTSCTNQFVRSLNGSGVATCATVANTDLANSSITINGSSVSLGGSITVSSTTLLSDSNTFTGKNIFANATTTLLTAPTAWITKLANLASAGFVKTAADGSLSVDTSTYLTSAVTAIGPSGQTQSGPTVTIASSTASFNGLTLGLQTVGAGNTLTNTPTVTGTLNNAGLTNSSVVINGTTVNLGDTKTITAASSTLLADSSYFSGANTFAGNTTFANATATNLAITAIANAIPVANGSGSLTAYAGTSCTNQFIRSVNGAGVATCASVNLVSDITGVLPVANGGTGWAVIQSGALMYGNGSSQLATTSAGANGQVLALLGGIPTWTATTTFGTGLSYSAGNVTNTGVLALGPLNQTTNGTATFATSTTGTDFTITGSGSTITFNLPTASASNRGLLSSADFSKFNSATTTFSWPLIYTLGTNAVTWGGLATSSALASGAAVVYSTGVNTVASVATSTPTIGSSLSYSGTMGNVVGGSSGTLSLNLGNANTWTALQTFNYSSSTAYSSFLTASSTNLFAGSATATNLSITGIASGNLLKTTTGGYVTAAVAGTDYANFAYLFPGNATTTGLGIYASTTIGNGTATGGLTVSGTATTTNLKVTSITSALHLADGAGNVGAYTGSSCTNQFVRSLNGSGVATCASVNLGTDITGTLAYANGGTGTTTAPQGQLLYGGASSYQSVATTSATIGSSLSYSGTFGALVGGAAGTLSLNLANANTWTALQTFSYASSTGFSTGYASSTNLFAGTLTIPSITSTLLKTDGTGKLTAAVAGTDYANFAYPFPSAATSTKLTFSGGLLSLASSTIGSGAQAGGLTISGGATTTGNLYVMGSTTIDTGLEIYSYFRSWAPLLGATNILDNGVGNATFNGGVVMNAGLQLSGPLYTGANVLDDGSGNLMISGSVGLATSSPWAKLSIHAKNGDATPMLFAIASSTASATSTLFSISNTGSTTLFQIPSSVLKTNANGTIVAAVSGTDYLAPGSAVTSVSASWPLVSSGGTTPTISWGGLSTTSNFTTGQLVYASGIGSLTSVATSSATIGSSLSYSGTFGNLVGGAAGTLSLNMGNANTWTALQTFANASTTLLSSSYASTTALYLGTGQGALYTGSGAKVSVVATSTQTIGSSLSYSGTQGSFLGGSSGTLSLNMGNANTWTALQTFANASTTLLSSSYASSTNAFFGSLSIANLSGLLKATNGAVSTATAGVDYVSGGRDWNVAFGALAPTTTLGILVTASSTIGNGTQAGGLTVAGGATTTGNAYFGGNVGIGTTSPWAQFSILAGGTFASQAQSSIFAIGSSSAGTATSTLFTVRSSGNVGIGTALPGNPLDVWNNAYTSGYGVISALRMANNAGGSNYSRFSFGQNVTNSMWLEVADQSNVKGDLLLQPWGGSVGIGTTTPMATSTVYGNMLLEGANRYLNFNSTSTALIGANGYGLRDNNGTMEFKNANGGWNQFTMATTGPTFSVNRNGSTQTVTAVQWVKIDWTNEQFDTNNNFDTTNDWFKPTVPGKYIITLTTGCLQIAASTGVCLSGIYKNGTIVSMARGHAYSSGIDDQEQTTSIILDMNGTTDYVEGYVYSTATTVEGWIDRTNMTGAMIAPVNGNNAAGWANDGTQSFLLDNADLVGIGTSTPWAKLAINPTAGNAANAFVIGSSTATSFVVTNGGNVGIGTTTPSAELEIRHAGATAGGLKIASDQTANYLLLGGDHPYIRSFNAPLYLNFGAGQDINLLSGSMIVKADGLVAIGTTTPYSKLTTWGTGSLFEAVTNASSTVFSIGQNGATTTAFAISGVASSLLKTNGQGSVIPAIAGTDYLTSATGLTSASQTYGSAQTGAITFATSSAATSNGVTVSSTITNSGGTFTWNPVVSVANIPNAALANSTISGVSLGGTLNALTAGNTSLTFSGSYDGSTARTVSLNMNNANTWTALQTFSYASSTGFSTGYASSTNLFAGSATTSNLSITGIASGNLLKTTTGGYVIPAVAGTDYANFAYPFPSAATSTMVNFSTGLLANQLGIGTTTPFASLQIATTTGKNLVLSDPSAGVGAKHWLLSSAQGNLIFGTTTDSYATSSPAVLTLASNGYTGVGTQSPGAQLSVQIPNGATTIAELSKRQSGNGGAYLAFYGGAAGSTARGYIGFTQASAGGATFWGTGELDNAIAIRSEGPVQFGSGGALTMTLDGSQNVGIGTNDPGGYKLNVNGTFNAGNSNLAQATTTNLAITNLASSLLKTNASGSVIPATPGTDYANFAYPFPSAATTTKLTLSGGLSTTYASTTQIGSTGNAYLAISNGAVGVASTTPWGLLSVNPNGITGPAFVVGSSTATSFIVDKGGKVGVGTSTPLTALHVGSGTLTIGTVADTISNLALVLAAGSELGTMVFRTTATPGATTIGAAQEMFNNTNGTDLGIRGENIYLGTSGTPTMMLNTNGNTGFGTTTPWAKLSIFAGGTYASQAASTLFAIGSTTAGTATSTLFSVDSNGIITSNALATSTFAKGLQFTNFNLTGTATSTASNGINLTSGCFSINGTCIGGTGGSGTVSSGTQGQFAFYNANGTTVSGTSTLFVAQTSLLGVGSSTPWAKLSVDTSNLLSGVPSFAVGSSTRTDFVITQAGNVGIGTTSPAFNLIVEGNTNSSITSAVRNWSSGASGLARLFALSDGGKGWLGFTSTGYTDVTGAADSLLLNADNASGGIQFALDGVTKMKMDSAGNFGIATSTPNSKFTVYGDAFLEGSNRYLNFATTTGTNGYGFRDNGGTMEFKNYGGTWQGVTTATSGPSFSVNKGGVDQTVTASTYTLLTLGTETFDTNNNFASNRFTPTVPGKYIVTGGVGCGGGTNNGCTASVYKNGSRIAEGSFGAGDTAAYSQVSAVIDMNGTTDYLELYGWDGGGTTISGVSSITYFTGAMIAPVNGNNAAGWTNDGTQSFLLDNADLVGIGTSTPWAKLAINPTAGNAANAFVIGSSTATTFLVDNGGRVGIGTTTPGSLFSIQSIANFQTGTSTLYTGLALTGNLDIRGTATSTFTNGINLSGGCFSVNGTCVGGSSGSSFAYPFTSGTNFGATTNSTTTNLSLFGGLNASTTVRFGNAGVTGQFLWDGTNGKLGLGTSTPWQLLSVAGTVATNAILPNGPYTTNLSAYDLGATGQRWNALWAGTLNVGTSTFSLKSNSASGLGFYTAASGGGTEAMTISTSGNVGIGTSNPGSILEILTGANRKISFSTLATLNNVSDDTSYDSMINFSRSSDGTTSVGGIGLYNGANLFMGAYGDLVFGSGAASTFNNAYERMRITSAGNVGIGTTTPYSLAKLDVNGRIYTDGSNAAVVIESRSGAIKQFTLYDPDGNGLQFYQSGTKMTLTSGGSLGIGTTTPWKTLSVVGTMAVNGLSTSATGNYLCINTTTWEVTRGNGSACTTSSVKFKTNIANLSYGLATVEAMRPVSFVYKPEMNMGTSTHIGFIAEEMLPLVPEVVNVDANGEVGGIDYPALTAVFASAIRDIATLSDAFRATLVAWMADATNGIQKFFAAEVHTKQLCVDDASGASTCVTKAQLDALIAGVAAAASSPPAATGSATLVINGNNPVQWQMGAAWQDNLGALFTHGTYSETIYSTSTVDTAQTGTTTIDYWATYYQDPAVPSSATTLHTTRQVVITATSTPDTTPPTITLVGSDPISVNVGDTYADPGVTVSDNVDTGLSYTIAVDGGTAVAPESLVVDTSTSATRTLTYSATDTAGNTGTATRTVNVLQP